MAEHFHSLRVAEIVPETSEANSIRFEIPPELRERFVFKAGQHLTLRATIDGEEVRRNYSLCTAPDESDWMVTVKRIGGGVFSHWGGGKLKPRGLVEGKPPPRAVPFAIAENKSPHPVWVAGGARLTPAKS